jgi:Ring finger domain
MKKMASSMEIFDIEEKDGDYKVVDVQEEGDIRKHCMNSECTLFGLSSEQKIAEKFVRENPEFKIRKRGVVVAGVKMDIIEPFDEEYFIGYRYEHGLGLMSQNIEKAIEYYQASKTPKAKLRLRALAKIYDWLKDDCPICLRKFDPIDKDFSVTPCQHAMHLTCLLDTLSTPGSSGKCPICRRELGYRCNKIVAPVPAPAPHHVNQEEFDIIRGRTPQRQRQIQQLRSQIAGRRQEIERVRADRREALLETIRHLETQLRTLEQEEASFQLFILDHEDHPEPASPHIHRHHAPVPAPAPHRHHAPAPALVPVHHRHHAPAPAPAP